MVATGTFSLSGPVAARETAVASAPFVDAPVVRFYDGNTNGNYGDTGDNILYYTNDANFKEFRGIPGTPYYFLALGAGGAVLFERWPDSHESWFPGRRITSPSAATGA